MWELWYQGFIGGRDVSSDAIWGSHFPLNSLDLRSFACKQALHCGVLKPIILTQVELTLTLLNELCLAFCVRALPLRHISFSRQTNLVSWVYGQFIPGRYNPDRTTSLVQPLAGKKPGSYNPGQYNPWTVQTLALTTPGQNHPPTMNNP